MMPESDALLGDRPVTPRRLPVGEWLAIRLLDILGAAAMLVLLAPLAVVIAWLIKRESPGPAVFRQVRVGYRGREFVMYKFRTMYARADPAAQAPPPLNDERVTPLGRWLRRHSLDELPQLINVLVGNMSLVGPRPEMPLFVRRYAPWQRQRLLVKPGVTGLWQILGRKDQPITANLHYDLYYLRHRSLMLNLWAVVGTIVVVIGGRD